MKNSSRRQVRTPVGNKTKRGAELEGTPKTPRSFEASPCKSTCVDSFSQQPEDQRLQIRSRRPLQWNISAKQEINAMAVGGMAENSLETTLCPFQHWDLKSRGESKEVAALSPICMNAIRLNADQQGGRKAAVKKLNEMPRSLVSPNIKECDAASQRKGHSRGLEDAHWNTSEDREELLPGSCPPSPESQISLFSEERIFFWSNAAFNQRPAHEETVCISKDTASSSSCSSLRSSPHHKIGIIERADCEAESKTADQDPLPESGDGPSCNANGRQRESPIVDGTADIKHGMGGSEISGQEDEEIKPSGFKGELAGSSLGRKLLLESNRSPSYASVLELDCGTFPYFLQQGSETKEHTDLQKCVMHTSQAVKNEEEKLETGLDEIEQEIQRLTERLTELQMQKRMREKERGRHGEENIIKKVETTSHIGRRRVTERERSMVAIQQRQCKRSAVTGAKRGKGAVNISSSSAPVLQSPRAQSLRSYHEVVSKVKEESSLASVSRQVQCPSSGSVGKLSQLRRSVSSASQRKESSSRRSDVEADRSKVLRRLSMSGASPLKMQCQQQQQRSLPSKGSCTPSRMVSSRYGCAITPDACRPSGSSTLACKKRHRPSSATLSPLPQPPASVACSPLKKIATLRSGYPSRSGFATPPKERQQLKPLSSVRTAAVCPSSTAAPSFSSSLNAQNLRHFPSKSPITRVDSPKSTAALHKCLESLLEDSKHFFRRLSPARSHLLHTPTLPQQL